MRGRKEQPEHPALPMPGAMREPGFSHKRSGIKAIVFDCFGVLAEDGWLPFKRRFIGDNEALAQQVADLGKQNDYGMLSNDEYFKQAAALIGCSQEELRTAVGRKVPNEELFAFIQTELKPEYKIGLLSNANYDVVNKLFTREQADLFDASVLSFESRLVKPDIKMFQLMADRLGIGLHEYIFVDDVERYVTAAEMFDIEAILYKNPLQLKREISLLLERA